MQKYETKQRKALIKLFAENAHKSFSVKDIAAAPGMNGVSVSAIYRNLSDLQDEGKVQRVTPSGSKKVYYRYTGAKNCERHLHMSCSKCGKTFHMDVPATDLLISEVLSESDFKVDSASTLLLGTCSKCRK
ncbi:MAG: transcriptional repressor [Clostridia bacterium]|nr:transcriptional repressor [Clostridia bacterium]